MYPHYGLGVASIPRAAVRRPISYGISTVAAVLFLTLTPVVLPLLYLTDLATGRARGKRARVWLLLGTTIWFEYLGVFGAVAIWLRYLGGRIDHEGWIAANYRLEFWWCRHHRNNLRRFAGVHITLLDDQPLHGGRSIIISRHSSHIDAIVPLTVLEMVGRIPCYTLKQDLQSLQALTGYVSVSKTTVQSIYSRLGYVQSQSLDVMAPTSSYSHVDQRGDVDLRHGLAGLSSAHAHGITVGVA